MLFHLVRAMGAGDVKLATALGCMAGLAGSPQLMFATAVAGGALAMVFIVASGRIVETLRNTLGVMAFHAQHGLQTHPTVNLITPAQCACLMGWRSPPAHCTGPFLRSCGGNSWVRDDLVSL